MNPNTHPLRATHPVWMCGMRPFFILALWGALVLLLLWTGGLAAGWHLPQTVGGVLVWHAHELILGWGMAGVAGFALTALPEFTGVPGASARQLRALVLLWCCARLGFWSTGWGGPWALALGALGQVGLPLALVWVLAPALWSKEGRRHASFGWLVLLLAGTSAGFYCDAWQGRAGLRWLHASLGVLMLLMVVAASRISLRIVNQAIAQYTPGAPAYIARPPKRHLAALCISLYTVVEWAQPGSALLGWLGLAAAAALWHVLGDWHVGAPLWRKRYVLLMYGMYWSMALGYAGLGLGALELLPATTAGRHLLAIGGMALGIFIVVAIAGRAHAGLPADTGPWLAWGGALLLAASAVRAGAALAGAGVAWWVLAALLWCAAFGLLLWRVGPGLWRARRDGLWGCQGPAA